MAQNAVLDSLRKIGSPEATAAVLGVWTTGKNDELKPIAANVFSFVSKDGSEKVGTGSALDALGKVAADNTADQNFRLEASVAYGRLARSKDRVSLLMDQAKKYKEASDKARKEADGPPKTAYEAAKVTYEAAKAGLDAAKAEVARKGGERKAPIELINKMTEAKVAFDKVKDPFTKAKATWKALDDKADAYRGYQRLFETHVARIEIAIHCKQDAKCYADTLVAKPAVEKDDDGNDKPIKAPQQAEKCKADWTALAGRLKAASSDIEVGQVHRRGEAGGLHRPDRARHARARQDGGRRQGRRPGHPALQRPQRRPPGAPEHPAGPAQGGRQGLQGVRRRARRRHQGRRGQGRPPRAERRDPGAP